MRRSGTIEGLEVSEKACQRGGEVESLGRRLCFFLFPAVCFFKVFWFVFFVCCFFGTLFFVGWILFLREVKVCFLGEGRL